MVFMRLGQLRKRAHQGTRPNFSAGMQFRRTEGGALLPLTKPANLRHRVFQDNLIIVSPQRSNDLLLINRKHGMQIKVVFFSSHSFFS